jgi:hypothetical protein
MQVSTIHNGTLITGVVLKCAPFYLEVAITSPFSKLSTSRRMPNGFCQSAGCVGRVFQNECASLLVELYEIANSCLKKSATTVE